MYFWGIWLWLEVVINIKLGYFLIDIFFVGEGLDGSIE